MNREAKTAPTAGKAVLMAGNQRKPVNSIKNATKHWNIASVIMKKLPTQIHRFKVNLPALISNRAQNRILVGNILGAAALTAALISATPASAASVIYWTQWNSSTVGYPSGGTAAGTISGLGLNVSYSGEVDAPRGDGVFPSWLPATTYSGGAVGNPPLASEGNILLTGGNSVVDTVTFSSPVVDPVMAIWSLGNAGGSASFTFQTAQPITIESGGPSAEFGGTSISQIGNTIFGLESNGTIEFHGTFTQLSWTSTVELTQGYAFTIGAPIAVPEPTTLAMILVGFGLIGLSLGKSRVCF
jgi:hypothetical protein